MKNDIDMLPFPNVGNSPFYTNEFHVGNMLPQMGSTKGFDSKLANTPIEDVIDADNKEIEVITREACKDTTTARKFVSEVGKLAKKYDANYFIVTDGASGINNSGNPAVKHARDSHIEWERSHNFDPYEDWSNTTESVKNRKNDKGETVPEKCPKCGSDIGIFLRGEPVFLCTNKKCNKYFGTLPFQHIKESDDDSLDDSKKISIKELQKCSDKGYPIIFVKNNKTRDAFESELKRFDDMIAYAKEQRENAPEKAKLKDILKDAHKNGMRAAISGTVLGQTGITSAVSNQKNSPLNKFGWSTMIDNLEKNKNRISQIMSHSKFKNETNNVKESENYNKLIKTYKERTTNMINTDNIVDNMFLEFFGESSNGGDDKIPDKIEPVVKTIESKGYQVKYASPGYHHTRFDNDRNKDGVINAKLVTTGRIIFSRNYKFKNTPEGWEWKVLENGVKALYVKKYTYNEKMGTEKQAFEKWQNRYLNSIKTWAAELPHVSTSDSADTKPDENF